MGTLGPLADILSRTGRMDDAIGYSKRTLDIAEHTFPARHAQVPTSQLSYATYLLKAGRLEEAETQIRCAAGLAAACDPPAPRLTAQADKLLGECQQKLAQNKE